MYKLFEFCWQFEGRKYCEHDFQMLFAPCCHQCGKFTNTEKIYWSKWCFMLDFINWHTDLISDVACGKRCIRCLLGRLLGKATFVATVRPLLVSRNPPKHGWLIYINLNDELSCFPQLLGGPPSVAWFFHFLFSFLDSCTTCVKHFWTSLTVLELIGFMLFTFSDIFSYT